MDAGAWITLGIFIIGGIINFVRLESKANTLKADFDEHKKQTPICEDKFSKLRLDIEALNQADHFKETYQTAIIKELLEPITKQISLSLQEYVDIKTGILTKEVEMIRQDNLQFKTDLHKMLQDFKEHTEKIITLISTKS